VDGHAFLGWSLAETCGLVQTPEEGVEFIELKPETAA